jgi:hypothetical protein
MPKKTTDREQLLAETFHGDWSSGPVSLFASRAAAAARRRRSIKSLALGSGTTLLVLAAVFVTAHRTPPVTHNTRIAVRPVPAPAYETISDAQLLALVNDRPLLLIQNDSDSARTIVALDP